MQLLTRIMLTVTILALQSIFAIENRSFSLTQKAHALIKDTTLMQELANPGTKLYCMQFLKHIIETPALYCNGLFRADAVAHFKESKNICVLIDENITWTITKYLGLEDNRILYREYKHYAPIQSINSAFENQYEDNFQQKLNAISLQEKAILTLNAVKEAACLMFTIFFSFSEVPIQPKSNDPDDLISKIIPIVL